MTRATWVMAWLVARVGLLAAQGVMIAPHAVFIDHRVRSGSVLLYNPNTEPAEVTISTFAVQVRQLLYVSGADMEHEFSAHLKASARQLQNVGKTLKELDRVEFEYYNKSLASLFNIGITGGMKKEKHPISWNDVVSCQDGDKGPLSESQGWQTVLTTVTRLDSLQKMFR